MVLLNQFETLNLKTQQYHDVNKLLKAYCCILFPAVQASRGCFHDILPVDADFYNDSGGVPSLC
jgi:hypothetical protein